MKKIISGIVIVGLGIGGWAWSGVLYKKNMNYFLESMRSGTVAKFSYDEAASSIWTHKTTIKNLKINLTIPESSKNRLPISVDANFMGDFIVGYSFFSNSIERNAPTKTEVIIQTPDYKIPLLITASEKGRAYLKLSSYKWLFKKDMLPKDFILWIEKISASTENLEIIEQETSEKLLEAESIGASIAFEADADNKVIKVHMNQKEFRLSDIDWKSDKIVLEENPFRGKLTTDLDFALRFPKTAWDELLATKTFDLPEKIFNLPKIELTVDKFNSQDNLMTQKFNGTLVYTKDESFKIKGDIGFKATKELHPYLEDLIKRQWPEVEQLLEKAEKYENHDLPIPSEEEVAKIIPDLSELGDIKLSTDLVIPLSISRSKEDSTLPHGIAKLSMSDFLSEWSLSKDEIFEWVIRLNDSTKMINNVGDFAIKLVKVFNPQAGMPEMWKDVALDLAPKVFVKSDDDQYKEMTKITYNVKTGARQINSQSSEKIELAYNEAVANHLQKKPDATSALDVSRHVNELHQPDEAVQHDDSTQAVDEMDQQAEEGAEGSEMDYEAASPR